MDIPPVEAKSSGLRPGRVIVRLTAEHRRAYEIVYAQYRSIFDSLPVLRERDFDGRPVRMTRTEFDSLSRAFASLSAPETTASESPFAHQERAKQQLFKRLQYLS
jgi:hypothetical protein